MSQGLARCPFCGQMSRMIWVRAHEQCANCGQVVVPCCNGETAENCQVETVNVDVDESSRTFAASQGER